jgi:hypothetical protein
MKLTLFITSCVLSIPVVYSSRHNFRGTEQDTDDSSCNSKHDQNSCFQAVDDATNTPCTWCIAGAIPSECMSQQQASFLPSGVFDCVNPGDTTTTTTTASTRHRYDDHDRHGGSILVSDVSGKTFHLRTTTENEQGTSDICDSQSKSISGYMDITGSEFDASGENKHLFFWMFEKRGESNATTPVSVKDRKANLQATDVVCRVCLLACAISRFLLTVSLFFLLLFDFCFFFSLSFG